MRGALELHFRVVLTGYGVANCITIAYPQTSRQIQKSILKLQASAETELLGWEALHSRLQLVRCADVIYELIALIIFFLLKQTHFCSKLTSLKKH